MKRLRAMLVCLPVLTLLWSITLAGCASGDLGNEELAFLRGGQLWTIDPNGANAFQVAAPGTGVVGYGFSPNHQLFVFRALDSTFAQSAAGKHLAINPLTGLAGDAPSTLNTVGIDGGSPIPIISSGPELTESDAWWSPDGTHLLYREGSLPPAWWISQNDQPLGIARRALPADYAIPSLSAQSTTVVEDSDQGLFTTDLAGSNFVAIQRGNLPGHPLPASLERVLWQPVGAQPALLYAVLSPASTGGQDPFELMLRTTTGQIQTLVHCNCRQFAWSPDGSAILYSTDQGYTVLSLRDGSRFQFNTEHGAVPYWSPDGKTLLLDGLHTLTLVHPATRQTRLLLSDGSSPVMTDGPLADNAATLQPLANNVWNADSQRFVMVTRGRTQWLGHKLLTGNGLYMITLNNQGQPDQAPFLVDAHPQDTQPAWSYVNPNTSFLF